LRRAFAALAIFCVAAVLASSGEIRTAELPPEARQTLQQIKAGGPFSYPNDGRTFSNREAHLPKRGSGYYREYTVATPGARDRGARRIVAGRGGELYYTEDHYRTFKRIIE
jgi:ribonuclease T1